jgi:hypothetical protein
LTWFNEAFDGIGIAKYETSFKIGINENQAKQKVLVLDPQLEPVRSNQSKLYTDFYQFGWAANKEAAPIKLQFDGKMYVANPADDKSGVVGRQMAGGSVLKLDDMIKLRTRPIYIPNASVTDSR